jgi:hypothetical protein
LLGTACVCSMLHDASKGQGDACSSECGHDRLCIFIVAQRIQDARVEMLTHQRVKCVGQQ